MSIYEILIYGLLPLFLLIDLAWQGYPAPAQWGWRTRALAVSAFTFWWSMQSGALWAAYLGDFHLIDGSRFGTLGGAALGILGYELAHYWYHRAAHRFDWLWYAGHQMHHSAERVDAWGAFYLHPFDAAMFATWSVLVPFGVFGLGAEAGALVAVFLTFNAVFQHANIRTPHWLGYLIQRPESHRIHHGRGVHQRNYSDLPLWDMLFGTFENPRDVTGVEGGFYEGASARIPEMLVGKDVSRAA